MTKSASRTAGAWLASLAILVFNSANGQTQRTEHTFKLDDPNDRPPATLEDVSWLIGSWSGEAFGNTFEAVWNPPSGGSMIGLFKTLNDGEVGFYEILLLVEEEGSLSLKVKHFSPDFVAWEEKADFINFRFIGTDKDAIHFSGLSFYRMSDDEFHGYIAMNNNGNIREEKLTYRRRQ